MDLRVYVDGVARIICDLTESTTVHDVIIALAKYKGKPGRYSLVEQSFDGSQRTVSPSELTSELISHPDWKYILHESSTSSSHRSKSLDGRKTPLFLRPQQSLTQRKFALTHLHPYRVVLRRLTVCKVQMCMK